MLLHVPGTARSRCPLSLCQLRQLREARDTPLLSGAGLRRLRHPGKQGLWLSARETRQGTDEQIEPARIPGREKGLELSQRAPSTVGQVSLSLTPPTSAENGDKSGGGDTCQSD